MENNQYAPAILVNAVESVRDLKSKINALDTFDSDIREQADHAASCIYEAVDVLSSLGYDEDAFTLRRAAEVCTGVSALLLGAVTRVDGQQVLAPTPWRHAMFIAMASVADDLQVCAIREASNGRKSSRTFGPVLEIL